MVDWNNERFISRSVPEIIHTLILEKRYSVISALEKYHAHHGSSDVFVKSTIRALYYELRPSIKNWVEDEDYDTIARGVFSEDVEEVMRCFHAIEDMLYSKNFIKADTVKIQDLGNVEKANKAFGV